MADRSPLEVKLPMTAKPGSIIEDGEQNGFDIPAARAEYADVAGGMEGQVPQPAHVIHLEAPHLPAIQPVPGFRQAGAPLVPGPFRAQKALGLHEAHEARVRGKRAQVWM